jgi:sulfonate transport system ATP-binding protein
VRTSMWPQSGGVDGQHEPAIAADQTVISYRNIRVAYGPTRGKGRALVALDDISLDVKKGTFLTIIGPSGCGKSTLLRLCAGFQQPTTGSVLSHGEVVRGLNHRVGFVTQETNLYPWMTTRQNIEFALEVRHVARDERRRRSDLYLSLMGLADFADVYPAQLSGGMQKRAFLAQTLIYEPEIILMDEPFAGVDSQTRMAIESDLVKLWNDLGLTIVFVTHDLAEALVLSDDVVVVSSRPGRVKTIYHVPLPRPRDVYGAQADPEFSRAYGELWESFRHDGDSEGAARG